MVYYVPILWLHIARFINIIGSLGQYSKRLLKTRFLEKVSEKLKKLFLKKFFQI